MTEAAGEGRRAGFGALRRLGALALIVAIVGLPLNHLFGFATAAVSAIALFTGTVRTGPAAWLAAVALAGFVIGVQVLLAPPLIEEGHNAFVVDAGHDELASLLPADVYRQMRAEFDALYPKERRCAPAVAGCWRAAGFPDRAYAFSADGSYDDPAFSRRVDSIDFDDPVWLRLGFINDLRYNWYESKSDVQRATRNRPFWMGYHRWRLDLPWYVAYRFPAAYAGGNLCWRGDVMWPDDNQHFDLVRHVDRACRTLTAKDIGHPIFGLAIKPDSLAMRFLALPELRARVLAGHALMLIGAATVLLLLLQMRRRALVWPTLVIGFALLVIALDDASFIGGLRPFDGGDDGLFYDGVGRTMLQHLLDGHWMEALRGGESVFYYGGPGLRYFRMVEKLIFGETYLGYLSLVLIFPMVLCRLWRRFLPGEWAVALTLLFVATPLGVVFGTSFVQYAALAARGFADPASYILFVCGLVALIGTRTDGPQPSFFVSGGAALLLALAIGMKPIVAPAAGILLGGAALAALWQKQWGRLAGLCIGFAPVLLIPLHNWYFGGVLVPFSTNATLPSLLVVPPTAWGAALGELLHGELSGTHLHRALLQIIGWLGGPSNLPLFAPLGAAAVWVTISVARRRHTFDPWLRLIAAAALAQHAVALFYATTPRYHFLTWLLTLMVTCAWLRQIALPRLRQAYPEAWQWAEAHAPAFLPRRWVAALLPAAERPGAAASEA